MSIYVERAFEGGSKPKAEEIAEYSRNVVQELQGWEFIEDVEVLLPTWIDVAYTWSWPNSRWRKAAMRTLESYEIYRVGRYALWVFHGIADSIRDGLYAGAAFREY